MRFDPHWCLFWGGDLMSSQLDVWLPYLKLSRHRFAVVSSRTIGAEDRDRLSALPNAMVVEPYDQALEWLGRCEHLDGFLYISSRPENFVVVNRQRRKLHVFIGHGESGKGGSGSRTGSLYDSVFVADYGVVRRFPRAIRRWVASGACATGAPIVEGIHKDPRPRTKGVRTILYAPTWESGLERGDYTSLDAVAPVLVDLLPRLTARGIQVIVRPHPWTGRRLPELTTRLEELCDAGAVTAPGKTEAFDRADVLIGDVSGVTAEFLLTGRAAIMPMTRKLSDRDKDADWLDVEYPWVYRWDVTAEGLLALLATIETTDPMRSRRAAEAKKKYRHHRSLDDAVRTFDIALSCVSWRKTPIPVRIPFEAKLLLARLRRGRATRRASGG